MPSSSPETRSRGTLRVCEAGHRYYKSSSCPVCPVCEAQRKPVAEFMQGLSAPARRALESAGITSIASLGKWNEAELLKLHGIGPASLPILRAAAARAGISLKKN